MAQSFSRTPRRRGREQHVQTSWRGFFSLPVSSNGWASARRCQQLDATNFPQEMLSQPYRQQHRRCRASVIEVACTLNHVTFLGLPKDCRGHERGRCWHLSLALLSWQSSLSPDGPIKWWRKPGLIFFFFFSESRMEQFFQQRATLEHSWAREWCQGSSPSALVKETGQFPSVTPKALARCQKKTDNITGLSFFICKPFPLFKETRLLQVKINERTERVEKKA